METKRREGLSRYEAILGHKEQGIEGKGRDQTCSSAGITSLTVCED